MRPTCLHLLVLPIVAAVLAASGCASGVPPVFRTAPGPEDSAVLVGLTGHVVVAHLGDGRTCDPIVALAPQVASACVSSIDETGVSPESGVVAEDAQTLLALQLGHDRTDFRDRTFTLVRRRCGTVGRPCTPDEQGIASWKAGAGAALYRKTLALSPDGRWLAVVPSSYHIRMNGIAPPAPSGYHFADQRHVGELILVDLRSVVSRNTGIAVLDEQPISWSSDGRRLLVVRAETSAALTPRMQEELRGREGEAGRTIPVIETWDVVSGAVEMLAIGLDPVWSPDQRTLLYAPLRIAEVSYFAGDDRALRRDRSDAYEIRDLASGRRDVVDLPGLVGRGGPIAFVASRKVLYWALPTVGTTPGSTTHNSPLVGPKQMMALKVGDLDTHAFATVVPAIDPRAQVGFHAGP